MHKQSENQTNEPGHANSVPELSQCNSCIGPHRLLARLPKVCQKLEQLRDEHRKAMNAIEKQKPTSELKAKIALREKIWQSRQTHRQVDFATQKLMTKAINWPAMSEHEAAHHE